MVLLFRTTFQFWGSTLQACICSYGNNKRLIRSDGLIKSWSSLFKNDEHFAFLWLTRVAWGAPRCLCSLCLTMLSTVLYFFSKSHADIFVWFWEKAAQYSNGNSITGLNWLTLKALCHFHWQLDHFARVNQILHRCWIKYSNPCVISWYVPNESWMDGLMSDDVCNLGFILGPIC